MLEKQTKGGVGGVAERKQDWGKRIFSMSFSMSFKTLSTDETTHFNSSNVSISKQQEHESSTVIL